MITLESALKPTSQVVQRSQSKKYHWFPRSRVVHKSNDPSQTDSNLIQLQFNTNRTNSILEANFLHPITVSSKAANDELSNQVKSKRRSFLANSLKRIGPIEGKNKNNLHDNRNDLIVEDKISIAKTDQRTMINSVDHDPNINTIPTIEDTNEFEEQCDFVMIPTNTNDLDCTHPLEIETRTILEKLGITSDMVCRSIKSGPRSDVMGAYRIVIHRLQKRKLAIKQEELILHESMKSHISKDDKKCAIL